MLEGWGEELVVGGSASVIEVVWDLLVGAE